MSNLEKHGGLSRRSLIKSSAIGSLALAAGGFSLPFSLRATAAAVQRFQRRNSLTADGSVGYATWEKMF